MSSASSISSARISKSMYGNTPKSKAALRRISSIISSLQRVQPDANDKVPINTANSPGQVSSIVPPDLNNAVVNNTSIATGDDALAARTAGSIVLGREGRLSSIADSMETGGSDGSNPIVAGTGNQPSNAGGGVLGSTILNSTSTMQSESMLPTDPALQQVDKRKLSSSSIVMTSRKEEFINPALHSSSEEKISPNVTLSNSIAGMGETYGWNIAKCNAIIYYISFADHIGSVSQKPSTKLSRMGFSKSQEVESESDEDAEIEAFNQSLDDKFQK